MEHRIETLAPKKLVGMRMNMSLVQNKTRELWGSFMKSRHEIGNAVGANLYSVQVFEPGYYENFNPANPFEKWATTEVSDFNLVPAGMETLELPGGLYAVFLHKGPASQGPQSFQYIFGTWMPASGYVFDYRPQFEVLGEKYKNEGAESEEEIWIPVKLK